MDVKFYIHGNPYGFSYMGEDEDKDTFFKRYYKNLREINELRVEAINTKGKEYFYYTYCLEQNVIDGENNRRGAYFAVTVRLDMYYKKARNFYYLLDSFFHSYLYGEILQKDKGAYSFLVQDFKIKESHLLAALNELQDLMSKCFSGSDFVSLKCSKSQSYEKLNLADADDDAVQELMKKSGEVSISESYPLKAVQKAEQDKNIEIDTLQKNKEKEIEEIKKEYKGADEKIHQLNIDLGKEKEKADKYQKDFEQADGELTRKKEELKKKNDKLKQYEKIEGQMAQINKIVSGYTNTIQCNTPEKPTNGSKDDSKRSLYILVFAVAQVVLSLMILSFLIFNSCNETPIPTVPPVEAVVATETEDGSKNSETQTIDYQTQYPDARIDVYEFTARDTLMKAGKEYRIKVKNVDSDVQGIWICSDMKSVKFDYVTDDGEYDKVTISMPGDYEISYEVNCKQITSRTIHVVQ